MVIVLFSNNVTVLTKYKARLQFTHLLASDQHSHRKLKHLRSGEAQNESDYADKD